MVVILILVNKYHIDILNRVCVELKRNVFMKISNLILFMMFFASCVDSRSTDENVKIIDIDVSQLVDFFDMSQLLDTSRYSMTILETTENNLVGHVDKLSVVKDRMYVLDYANSTIFIYDIAGKYLSKIAARGRARNEYTEIADFYVSENYLYLLDNMGMKLLIYDLCGQYIRTLDISMYWANGMFAVDGMIYLINHNSDTQHGKYHIFEIDSNGVLKNRYWKFKKMTGIGPDMNVCSNSEGGFHVCILPENNIYKIDTSFCRLDYKVNFVDKNLPTKYFGKDLRTLIQKRVEERYILGVEKIQESQNYLFVYFRYNRELHTALYNKLTEETVVCEGLQISSLYGIGLGNYYVIDDDIYEVIDANIFRILVPEIKKYKKKNDMYIRHLEKISNEVSDEDNPIIIRYRLR